MPKPRREIPPEVPGPRPSPELSIRGLLIPGAGLSVWAAFAVFIAPSPLELGWGMLILLFAALVLVPLAAELSFAYWRGGDFSSSLKDVFVVLALPLGMILAIAYVLPQRAPGAALASGWLYLSLLGLIHGVAAALSQGRAAPRPPACAWVAYLYLVIGAFWAFLDRLGAKPLDFEPVIVFLTAIHFHYAGFLLLVLTGLAIRESPGRFGRITNLFVIAAPPLTAIGITATKAGSAPGLECLSALFMAIAGLLVARLYLGLMLNARKPLLARLLWGLSALMLTAGMALAAIYGVRFYWPGAKKSPLFDIAWMRAIHGTINSLGFALPALIGWVVDAIASSNRMNHDPAK